MENTYLNRLSIEIRNIIEEVEQASSIEITVTVDPSRMRGILDQTGPMACEMNDHGATILIPSPDQFPEDSVLHELLHIRRILETDKGSELDKRHSRINSNPICRMSSPDPLSVRRGT